MSDEIAEQNLSEVSRELLAKARKATSGRAARGVYSGKYLRQALLTLTPGSRLADHDSPPEATLQVVQGRVVLATGDESWELTTGDLIQIPPQRHSVEALEESAFLLTIRMDVTGK